MKEIKKYTDDQQGHQGDLIDGLLIQKSCGCIDYSIDGIVNLLIR